MGRKKSKSEQIDEAVQLLEKIEAKEAEVETAARQLEEARETAKTKKGVWLTKVDELRALCRTRKRWAAEAKNQPLLARQKPAGKPENDGPLAMAEQAEKKAAEQAAQGAAQHGPPERIRLTQDCEGLGKAGSEWDVVLVDDRPFAKTGEDACFSLANQKYEVIDPKPAAKRPWQTLPIDTLKLTENVLTKCGEHDVLTLGDFQEFQAKHGDFWAKELGLRGSQGAAVLAAFDVFWAEHPELCDTKPWEG